MIRALRAVSVALTGVLATAGFAPVAQGAFMTVCNITSNDAGNAAIGEAQILIDVESAGTDTVTGDTLLTFTFHVDGPEEMAVTQVYFEGGFLSMIVAMTTSDAGVGFQVDRGPPVLPGGNPFGFRARDGLRAGAKPPTRHNGVDPGESLSVTVSLREGFTFADATSALIDGTMRIGMHVQGFADGGSESFLNKPLIPAPGSAAAFGLAGLALSRRRRV